MTGRYLDKDKPLILTRKQDFFGAPAPDSMPEWAFDCGDAIHQLRDDLQRCIEAYGGLTDHPPEQQIQAITEAYTRFRDTIGADTEELKKKVKSLQLENGRLKAKINRLEEESNTHE